MHELIIRNGNIVDGSGDKAFLGDIAIDDGKITKVGVIEEKGEKEKDETMVTERRRLIRKSQDMKKKKKKKKKQPR